MQDDLSSPQNTSSNEDNLNESDFSIDETAPKDQYSDEVQLNDSSSSPSPEKPQKKSKRINLTKKQKIILIILGIVVLLGLLFASWKIFHQKPKSEVATPKAAKKEEPKPTTVQSKMTGLQVAPEINDKQVTAVMIENSPDARPQAGLRDAGVIYEAVAEGGITRFMALYQDTHSDYIGPVRSARPYYVNWALPFDAALAHVGGSPDALAAIKNHNLKDLDQFANSGAYQRINTRYAPHNVYTSSAKLEELENKKGFSKSSYTGFVRKPGDTPKEQPDATSIDVKVSGFLYNSHWDYDKGSNSYKRSEGGKPHVDEKTGFQLSSKVVVVLVTSKGVMSDGYHTTYGTTGGDKMFVYQDGTVLTGKWQKNSDKEQYTFTDNNGKPLALNPGQTWITLVANQDDVSPRP